MKKFYYSIICTLFLLFSANCLFAQENTEIDLNQNVIIEQCLTFAPLLEKIPVEILQQNTEYYILNQETFFKFSPELKINDKEIFLVDKPQLDLVKLYFDFFTLNIDNNKANVLYYATYKVDNIEQTISTTIQFEKSNSVWKIINYSF